MGETQTDYSRLQVSPATLTVAELYSRNIADFQIDPQYQFLESGLRDLLERGNLSDGEILPYRIAPQLGYSRVLVVRYPTLPENTHLHIGGVGLVTQSPEENAYILGMPDSNRFPKDTVADFGTTFVNSEGRMYSKPYRSPIGYKDSNDILTEQETLRKLAEMQQDVFLFPNLVCYGFWREFKQKYGFIVTLVPDDYKSTVEDAGNCGKWDEFEESFLKLVLAIRFLHAQGMIHNQLHMGNWGISHGDKVYLHDFETAQFRADPEGRKHDLTVALSRSLKSVTSRRVAEPVIAKRRIKILERAMDAYQYNADIRYQVRRSQSSRKPHIIYDWDDFIIKALSDVNFSF